MATNEQAAGGTERMTVEEARNHARQSNAWVNATSPRRARSLAACVVDAEGADQTAGLFADAVSR